MIIRQRALYHVSQTLFPIGYIDKDIDISILCKTVVLGPNTVLNHVMGDYLRWPTAYRLAERIAKVAFQTMFYDNIIVNMLSICLNDGMRPKSKTENKKFWKIIRFCLSLLFPFLLIG